MLHERPAPFPSSLGLRCVTAALVTLLLIACGADEDGPHDTAAPTDTRDGSADAAAVDAGDTVESMDDATDTGEGSQPDTGAGDTGPVLPPAPDYPLDDQLRVDEITMKCTHNSYHVEPEFPAVDSHRYTHLPLDQQLGQQGVRAFELDIHVGTDFPVFHIPLGIDDVSTCPTLAACLEGVRTWSEQNPGHHLVVVWVEIKDELDPEFITMREDGMRKAAAGITTIEEVLRATQDVEDFSAEMKTPSGGKKG